MNVMYDEEGNQYPIDDQGQLYVPLGYKQIFVKETHEENINETRD